MRPRATNLGPGWSLGEDGLFWRRAARVLLVDEQNRLLLVRGHDVDQPERTWWFTVGGGIDPGESAREAAVREVREESGLAVSAADLVGPVLTRSAIFDFQREQVRQDEEFFMARIERPGAVRTDGWTAVERSFMDEARWWDLAALARVQVEVFPENLAELTLQLLGGWDGRVRHLGLAPGTDDAASTPRR
ncbi:NUDIX hydrolase [Pseudactinotalea sp. Z1748]|uniref:NUDIX hydrolase n=1 Tax=Pseudactinotalea sp. Z1748 TaxID=3413027 RepID=UPI003C7EC222